MDNYTIDFINRVKEEVDPAEWFLCSRAYDYDTDDDSASDIVPEGRLIEGSLVDCDTILIVARTSDSQQRVQTFIKPVAVIHSDKLCITFDVYDII